MIQSFSLRAYLVVLGCLDVAALKLLGAEVVHVGLGAVPGAVPFDGVAPLPSAKDGALGEAGCRIGEAVHRAWVAVGPSSSRSHRRE